MSHTVFYSWQTDISSNLSRNFIEKALSQAIKLLKEDLSIDAAIRVGGLSIDKDTKGVAGTPPIVETIFRKIDEAAVFLADLTFVAERLDGRPSPNPNVLLEYGWALKSLGYPRIICVMNVAYGAPTDETLPFNMKHLRWPIQFHLPDTADEMAKADALAGLVKELKGALNAIFQSKEFRASIPAPPAPPSFQPATPVDGPARFRKRTDPIGVIELGYGVEGSGQEIRLTEGPGLWLRVMPTVRPDREWSIPELRRVMSQAGMSLLTLGYFSSWGFIRGSDGFGYAPYPSDKATQVAAVSYAFKSGEVWSIYTGSTSTPVQGETFWNIERMLTECFLRLVRFMRQGLHIDLPYQWIAGIEGVKGKRMQRFAPPGQRYISDFTGPCLEDVVTETGSLSLEEDKPQLALRPFFRKVYDLCGEERGDYMDQSLLKLV